MSVRSHCRPLTVSITCAVLVLSLLLMVRSADAVWIDWNVSSSIGQPTEIQDYVGLSPSVGGSAVLRLTNSTSAGVLADYTWYNSKLSQRSGFQWRVMVITEWERTWHRLPDNMSFFGQIGLGTGHMEYVGLTTVEAEMAPSGRLAAGVHYRTGRRTGVRASLSLERLEGAPNAMDRLYPTMIRLEIGITFRFPSGGPLFASETGGGHSERMGR